VVQHAQQGPFGVTADGGGVARPALRVARLSFARRLIASQLSDPHLPPALIADELGVSIRHVHALFEDDAASLSQTATAIRLDEAESCWQRRPPLAALETPKRRFGYRANAIRVMVVPTQRNP
jgi:AraC-like DNA-binding protein